MTKFDMFTTVKTHVCLKFKTIETEYYQQMSNLYETMEVREVSFHYKNSIAVRDTF